MMDIAKGQIKENAYHPPILHLLADCFIGV